MGQLLAAPITACGTFLGGCVGTCIGVGCCKLAGSGEVSSEKAARYVLFYLQAFTVVLAWIVSATPDKWLPWTCDKLDVISMGDVGVCGCRPADKVVSDTTTQCWSDQLVYRVEASAFVILCALLLMTLSGCSHGASRSFAVAKFMGVVILSFAFLFVPNGWADVFGNIATCAAALFLVVQALLMIDFGYAWNELWHTNALNAQRRELGAAGSQKKRQWEIGIVVCSGVLLLAALVTAIALLVKYDSTSGRVIIVAAMLIALGLLVVSITEWCKHGNLLCSCVVTLYTIWLVIETMSKSPDEDHPTSPVWFALTVGSISLLASAQGAGEEKSASSNTPGALMETGQAGAEAGASAQASAGPTADETVTTSDTKDFAKSCVIHLAAILYVCALLAPKSGNVSYVFYAIAVFLSLFIYGWTLVAPMLLKNRDFS